MLDIPFYANTPDNTHCFQAALKMVLQYFLPDKDFSWEELDKITAKQEGMWTWQMAGLLWMKDNGFDVLDYENFNYEQFIKDGEDFLLKEYGEEVGRAMINHSIVKEEIQYAQRLIKEVPIHTGEISLKDVQNVLANGYVPICLINSRKLNSKEGYVGHFVVVREVTEDSIILNDPGLPPQESRKVSKEDFERAWADPSEKEKNIFACKLSK